MIATGSVLGPDVLAGVPADLAFTVWQVLRALQLWTSQPDRQREDLFDPEYMAEWERALLTGSLEPDVRFPLAVIVGELAARPAGEGRLSWACVCVADWALGHRAVAAALAFTEAAALASPTQARYAWLAGRLLRTHGESRQAERWLRRAYRVAVTQKDGETQARSLTALGNLALRRGSYPAARAFHTRALRISRRWRLREHEGMANHDLFTLSLRENNRADAERFARGALEAYRAAPDRIPRLAHDIAYWWMEHGYYARALRTFEAVRAHLPGEDRLRVLANIARSHAGLGNPEQYRACVATVRGMIKPLGLEQIPASALLEMANGAVTIEDWVLAEELIRQSYDTAQLRGEADNLLTAEALAASVARRDRVSAPALMEIRGSNGEQLANDLVELLTAEDALAA